MLTLLELWSVVSICNLHMVAPYAGLATPRESPSRELGTRFGGLMAYSYTRQRLSTSEEVLGRGLGKGDWRKNTQPSMCALIHPPGATRVSLSPVSRTCTHFVWKQALGLATCFTFRGAGARGGEEDKCGTEV